MNTPDTAPHTTSENTTTHDATLHPMTATPLLERLAARRRWTPEQRRTIRLQAGATLADFATELGAAAHTIADWERGRRKPRGDAEERYFDLLDQLAELVAPLNVPAAKRLSEKGE